MKAIRVAAVFGLGAAIALAAVFAGTRSEFIADARQATPAVKPSDTPFEVRFVGLFLAGPTDGATIEWDAVTDAASYSIDGTIDWSAMRQGEGVCTPANAARRTALVDATVPAGTTTFTASLPQDALPPQLVWWSTNITIVVTVLDPQGTPIHSGTLNQQQTFDPCATADERAALPRFTVRAGQIVSFDPVAGAASYRVTGSSAGTSFRSVGRCVGREAVPFDVSIERTTLPLGTNSFAAPVPLELPPPGQEWGVFSVFAVVEALDQRGTVIAEGAGTVVAEPAMCGGPAVRPPETGHGPDSY